MLMTITTMTRISNLLLKLETPHEDIVQPQSPDNIVDHCQIFIKCISEGLYLERGRGRSCHAKIGTGASEFGDGCE